ncbi:pterin-4-alpha-carbinolamine dehydratase [Elsinoe australis]|uniref:4a-hydroxytetrahydrobiopterin dehydratase n=1 Tax=Elsinoe australis TaxID=40998 RepID=A0A4U7B528_9PEZI|nr:pterin-4-alpha-carbinolamine dehydratase [Elsinoe australis]
MAISNTASIPSEFQPRVSKGHDQDQVRNEAAGLVSIEVKGTRRWHLTQDGQGLERVFRFKTFKATWEFMNDVAAKCKEAKHHPEWMNIYNKTHITWTTHNPSGLSSKDISMAQYCDEAASSRGEVDPSPEQQREDDDLFRSKRMEAPDCCSRKAT